MLKISVIVPAYNVGPYLSRCLDSVRSQTYDNLEIIVVDDGSTDNTGLIADEAAGKDSRIRVIHQENGGLSKARNTAFKYVTGDLITNVDADDFIRSDMLEIMVSDMEETDADLVICGHREGSEVKIEKSGDEKSMHSDIRKYSGREKFMLLFNERKRVSIVFWGKLYRKEILKGISFPEGKIHEDEYIVHYVFDRAETVVYDPRILYQYYKRDDSITTEGFSLRRLDCIPALLDRIDFFEKKGDRELLKSVYTDFMKRTQYYYYGVRFQYPEEGDISREVFGQYIQVFQKAEGMLPFFSRLRFWLFIRFPIANYHIKRFFGAKSIGT